MSERAWDKRLHVRTIGREDETNGNYSPYEPTPYVVLERLADSGYVRRKDWLLDYGCGKGRVAFYMASVVGCRVTGIDQSQKLIDIAQENRRTSRLGDRIRLVCGLAEQYPIGDEDVFFFFNPISEKIFEGVLRRLDRSWQARPRALTVICYYPSEAYLRCLEESPSLRRVDMIDCNDLFGGRNPRECVAIYAFPAP